MGLFDRDRGDEQKTEQQEAEEPLRRDEMEQAPRDEQPAREQSEEGGSTAAAVKRERTVRGRMKDPGELWELACATLGRTGVVNLA